MVVPMTYLALLLNRIQGLLQYSFSYVGYTALSDINQQSVVVFHPLPPRLPGGIPKYSPEYYNPLPSFKIRIRSYPEIMPK